MSDYPYLRSLLGGYFNQDYDIINGPDISDEGIIKYYIEHVSDNVLHELLIEIDDFECKFSHNLDASFETQFSPELCLNPIKDFFTLLRKHIIVHLAKRGDTPATP
ncbi:hypothetical protein PMPD1_0550 [Paramixta manurensis]|uniref:CdiI immunity protein domain-containing protein n=1 Tax=Paramixta manurensis TaxID=2740817 RepID=A0A6M8U4F1_9GAMM|nr:hypothetical protein PMPD1_0550 [Erwiniaceae bacterium PD-1]